MGTTFGGSIYAAVDPLYAMMLLSYPPAHGWDSACTPVLAETSAGDSQSSASSHLKGMGFRLVLCINVLGEGFEV
jgi:hypothetical protein